ncbi:MAG: LLM class flavin-dependent oxidoreductase [Pseudomonadota bacterium]
MSIEAGLMSLGDLVPHPATGALVSEAQRHRSLLDQAELAERTGFTSVHLGEHHFSDYMLSAPPVVLAAIGERTATLKLSTSVTLAGNLDPVRVAEDYATVDVLSQGRAEMVLGRGNLFVKTYQGFGQEVSSARQRYDESVSLLVKLLREENVTWSGEFRAPLDGHTTRPRPVDTLPLWIGAGSIDSAHLAAELGCGLMLPSVFGRPEMFVPIAEAYRQRCAELGRAEDSVRVGACCHTHIGASTEAARQNWAPYYQNYWDFVGGLLGDGMQWPPFNLDELLAGPGMCGSADFLLEKIAAWDELFNLDRQLFMFDLGGMDPTEVLEVVERFGAEVVPHI